MGRNENVAREEWKQDTKAEIIQLYAKRKVTYYKIKNAVLSMSVIIAFLLVVNCVGAWENNVPNMIPYVIGAIVGIAWLTIFGYANRDYLIYRG